MENKNYLSKVLMSLAATLSSSVQWTPAACSSKYHDLKVEVDHQRGIALVTLNRPPMNSVTMRMHKELGSIWPDLDADPQVKVLHSSLFVFCAVWGVVSQPNQPTNQPTKLHHR